MLNNTVCVSVCVLSAGMVNTRELLFSVGTRDRGGRRQWIVWKILFWPSQTRTGNTDYSEERAKGVCRVRSSESDMDDVSLQRKIQTRTLCSWARARRCGYLHTVKQQGNSLDPPCPQSAQSVPAAWTRQGPYRWRRPVLRCSATHQQQRMFKGRQRRSVLHRKWNTTLVLKNRSKTQMNFQNKVIYRC